MSLSLLTVTDEPRVTERTRFWLWSELRTTYYDHRAFVMNRVSVTHGEPIRINVEVTEDAYRAAYDEFIASRGGTPADMTLPLDDHWWRGETIAGDYRQGWTLHRTRGGFIDWEPWP